MPVIINRRGELVIVNRPASHFLPPVPPPFHHHVAQRTIYRRHSANAAMIGANNQAQNYVHLGGRRDVVDNTCSALESGYIVITTRRLSLPNIPSTAGIRYAGAHPIFTPLGQLHAAMHLNANVNTQANNRAHHTVLHDNSVSSPSFHTVHAPTAKRSMGTPSSTDSSSFKQSQEQQHIEEAPPVLPNFSMDKLRELMAKSNDSMKNLEEIDRRQGRRRCDAQNMVKTARSRKQLLENKILPKWDGSPLIAFHRQADGSVKVLAGPNGATWRKKHTCRRRVVQRRV